MLANHFSESSIICSSILGAAITTTPDPNRWVIPFAGTVLFGCVGWLIQNKLVGQDKRIDSITVEIKECNGILNRILGSLENQNMRVEDWHNDRKEIFDRLRKVENETQILSSETFKK